MFGDEKYGFTLVDIEDPRSRRDWTRGCRVAVRGAFWTWHVWGSSLRSSLSRCSFSPGARQKARSTPLEMLPAAGAAPPRYVEEAALMGRRLVRLNYEQQILDMEWRTTYKRLLHAEAHRA